MRSSNIVCSALFVLAMSPALRAEDVASPARALFKEGRELVAKGDYQAACSKFEESLALEGGLGTQFNLADCWERIGKTASAQALFLGAAASAKASGQAEREQVLRERAASLNPRISKLVIEVDATDPKLIVKRDALPLEADTYGKAVAVDPGSYVISAKAPRKKSWSKTVQVKAGAAAIVTVTVPELLPEEKALPVAAATAAKATADIPTRATQAKPAPMPERDRADLNYKALGLGAFGVGAAALGTVMAIRYNSANHEAKGICPASKNCSTDEVDRHQSAVDRASLARTWSYIGFGVAGASALGAAAFLILEPSRSTKRAWHAQPELGAAGVYGASVTGSF